MIHFHFQKFGSIHKDKFFIRKKYFFSKVQFSANLWPKCLMIICVNRILSWVEKLFYPTFVSFFQFIIHPHSFLLINSIPRLLCSIWFQLFLNHKMIPEKDFIFGLFQSLGEGNWAVCYANFQSPKNEWLIIENFFQLSFFFFFNPAFLYRLIIWYHYCFVSQIMSEKVETRSKIISIIFVSQQSTLIISTWSNYCASP